MTYLWNESMWICWFLRSLPHLKFRGESIGWKRELNWSAGKGSSVVGVLRLFWGEPGMCCVGASDLEDQSQALHMVWISFFFLHGEGCLTSQGGAQAKLGVTVPLEAGPANCVTLAARNGLFFVTQSGMASGDAESLASPGTLPGHTGSQNVKKLLRDQGSWQLTVPHTSSQRPVPDNPWGGSKVIQSQPPAHTHFHRMEDILPPPQQQSTSLTFLQSAPILYARRRVTGPPASKQFFCNSLKSN